MGSFANALFKAMLGWLQGAVSAIWSAFTTENGGTLLTWIGRNWILLAGILCATGLIADLCVYLVRWKPFKVWKSFFHRDKEDETDTEQHDPVYYAEKNLPRERAERATRVTVRRELPDDREEPDLSSWKEEEEEPEQSRPAPAEKPVTVTKSGYVVPADSPYRRPSRTGQTEKGAAPEPEPIDGRQDEETADSLAVPRRKRRRVRVSELFADPEEEIREFDAPQHVIDARTAYHEPVYPRGWKKSEDSGE